MTSLKKTQSAAIIREHFRSLANVPQGEDVFVSARNAGRMMVEIYRLLTNEMPQAPGIEMEYQGDETPAVEWSTPIERRPDELFYVDPGFDGEPDILIKGDQDGSQEIKKLGTTSSSEAEQGRSLVRIHEEPSD